MYIFYLQEEVADEVCALDDAQFNSLADELRNQLPLVSLHVALYTNTSEWVV